MKLEIEVIEASDRTIELATSWYLVHVFTLITDDCLDEDNLADRHLLQIGAGLCLQRGLTQLLSMVPTLQPEQISTIFNEAAEAVSAEVRNLPILEPFLSEARNHHKMAIAKVWVLLLLTDNRESPAAIQEGLELLEVVMTAYQWRDDLIDWERDWKSNRLTPALQETILRLRASKVLRSRLTPDEVLAGMIHTQTFAASLDHIRRSFQRVLQNPRLTKRSLSILYLGKRLAEIDAVGTIIADVPPPQLDEPDQHDGDWLSMYVKRTTTIAALQRSRARMIKEWGIYGCH